MLNPWDFYGKTDIVEQYYQDLEDYLLKDIAGFLLMSNEIGGKADRDLFVLEQMGLHEAEITQKLSEITRMSENAIRDILMESVMTSFSNEASVLSRFFSGDIGPLNNPVIRQVMEAEWTKTCGEIENLTQTAAGQYRRDLVTLLNDAELKVATGNMSYSQAVCDTLDAYAGRGMTVVYPTGSKRSIESAVRCAVVTSMNQTAAQVTNKYISEGEIEYVLITAHLGARYDKKHPTGIQSHDYWQGKAYKIVGSEPGYPNLLESTGYDIDPVTGEGKVVNPLGLHGYNCRHSHQPWDKGMRNPWIDENGKPIINPKDSKEVYDKQQNQRRMERDIRSLKRQLKVKQTEIDYLPDGPEKDKCKADYDICAYKLSNKTDEYNAYCKDNDLQKQSERVKVAGFGRSESRKATARAKRYQKTIQ